MAIYIKNEDSQEKGYWRAQKWDSEGRIVFGVGDTEEEAKENAKNNLITQNDLITKSSLHRLNEICQKDRIGSKDVATALKLINEILHL